MKTRVTSQVPTDKQVESLIADVTAIQKRIEAFTISLSNADRQATLKMRPGGDRVVAALAQLAEQTGITLPVVSGDDMVDDLAHAQRLQPLANAARQLTRRLDDTILNAQGQCWWAATALYTALSRIAAGSPQIEAALEPVVSFFALGSRKKTPPPVTPPVTPPGAPRAPSRQAVDVN